MQIFIDRKYHIDYQISDDDFIEIYYYKCQSVKVSQNDMLIHDSDINIISEKKIFIKLENKKIQDSQLEHEAQVYITFINVVEIFFVH